MEKLGYTRQTLFLRNNDYFYFGNSRKIQRLNDFVDTDKMGRHIINSIV